MTAFWIMGGLVLLAVLSLVIVLLFLRKRGLGTAQREQLKKQWAVVREIPNPSLRVLEAEKVLDRALTFAKYAGTFGEKLKQAGPRLPNEQAVWNAHKLRNRIAHEVGIMISPAEASAALSAFEKALLSL